MPESIKIDANLVRRAQRIHDHFGHSNQQQKCGEECAELITELLRPAGDRLTKPGALGREVADVFLTSLQLLTSNTEIGVVARMALAEKLERVEARIHVECQPGCSIGCGLGR